MSTSADSAPDPLAPIEFVVTCIGALLLLFLLVTVPLAIFGTGSIFGIGEKQACVVVDRQAVPFGEVDGRGGFYVPGLRPDASFAPQSLTICDNEPTFAVKTAAVAGQAADLLLVAGVVVLTWRLIRTSRRTGLFTPRVATATRAVGWCVLLGGLAAQAVQFLADGLVVRSAVPDVTWGSLVDLFDVPWTMLITGVGVITTARVLHRAVRLQDDVDATI